MTTVTTPFTVVWHADLPSHPINCPGCGRPPNHVKAYAVGQEIIHCPRCDREVIRSLRSESAVREWNKGNEGNEA